MNMKKVIVFIACIFISLSMLFALDTSTVGNVSLNVRMDSVAIGFVNSEKDAKDATSSTSGTNHEIKLTPNGTEFGYDGNLEFYYYWKVMTGETNLKVSLSTNGPLILDGKTISDAEDYQKINYRLTASKSDAIEWMGDKSFVSKSIEGSNYASDKIEITIKDSTNPQIYTQGVCKLTLNLLEEIKTKAYGEYGCMLTLTVTNI